VRGRRVERDGRVRGLSSTTPAWSSSASRPRARGVDTDKHSASLTKGTPGVLHGALSYLLQDAKGQVINAHSISAGSTTRASGPSTRGSSRAGARPTCRDDEAALRGFVLLSRLEGIIPALETSHAVAWIADNAGPWAREEPVLLCVSGRGDKDVAQVSQMGALPDVGPLPEFPG
jgi:tryptophan synthase beta chain